MNIYRIHIDLLRRRSRKEETGDRVGNMDIADNNINDRNNLISNS